MSPHKIIRAWKDEDYRHSLSDAERAMLPENPAGLVELDDDDLVGVNGGTEEVAGTTTITIPITSYVLECSDGLSCKPSCDSSVHKGSCAFLSIGCCGPALDMNVY